MDLFDNNGNIILDFNDTPLKGQIGDITFIDDENKVVLINAEDGSDWGFKFNEFELINN